MHLHGIFRDPEPEPNLRFCEAKVARFGVVNEVKKSTKYFSERMNGGVRQLADDVLPVTM